MGLAEVPNYLHHQAIDPKSSSPRRPHFEVINSPKKEDLQTSLNILERQKTYFLAEALIFRGEVDLKSLGIEFYGAARQYALALSDHLSIELDIPSLTPGQCKELISLSKSDLEKHLTVKNQEFNKKYREIKGDQTLGVYQGYADLTAQPKTPHDPFPTQVARDFLYSLFTPDHNEYKVVEHLFSCSQKDSDSQLHFRGEKI